MQQEDSANAPLNLMPNLYTFSQTWKEERKDRLAMQGKIMPYGVSFLDDVTGGIAPDDLVVFGARTGAGKTQLALQIALSAAKQGKRVTFFALESTRYELARRTKFAMVLDQLRKKYINPDFLKWVHGEQVEDEDPDPQSFHENISLIYRLETFSLKDLERYILVEKMHTDLVIIDHLHFLDLEGDVENKAVRDAVKTIRSINLDIGKPIILISHIRKRDKRDPYPVPTLEDLHGSSEISKMATQVFALAKADVMHRTKSIVKGHVTFSPLQQKPGTVATILKMRADGSREGQSASLKFDFMTRGYKDEYSLVKWDNETLHFADRDEVPPYWAERSTNEVPIMLEGMQNEDIFSQGKRSALSVRGKRTTP